MWKFRKQYKDVKVFVRGYGSIDTQKENANDVYKASLLNNKLIKYIEKHEEQKAKSIEKPTTKQSKK